MEHESTLVEGLEAPVETPSFRPQQHGCACATPIPQERAGYKGASRIYCVRCNQPVPIRLSR
jgi:hypothetical protein